MALTATRARASGSFRGLLIGVLGGLTWAVVGSNLLGSEADRLLWNPAYYSANPELEAAFLFIVGPLVGLIFSIALSGAAERKIRAHKITSSLLAGATAGGLYAAVLGGLFTLPILANVFQPVAGLVFALFLTGFPYAGLLPLMTWALLAGVIHGLLRPRPTRPDAQGARA